MARVPVSGIADETCHDLVASVLSKLRGAPIRLVRLGEDGTPRPPAYPTYDGLGTVEVTTIAANLDYPPGALGSSPISIEPRFPRLNACVMLTVKTDPARIAAVDGWFSWAVESYGTDADLNAWCLVLPKVTGEFSTREFPGRPDLRLIHLRGDLWPNQNAFPALAPPGVPAAGSDPGALLLSSLSDLPEWARDLIREELETGQ